MRNKHPHKDVEETLIYLESKGWSIEPRAGGHTWGIARCPYNDGECRDGKYCQMSIWSTPKNPTNFAKLLKQKADKCVRD